MKLSLKFFLYLILNKNYRRHIDSGVDKQCISLDVVLANCRTMYKNICFVLWT